MGRFRRLDPLPTLTPYLLPRSHSNRPAFHSTFVARKCHTGLCRLTAFATSPSRSNSALPSNHAQASLKRANPDDWLDGQSPNSSMHSPEGGSGSMDEDSHKAGSGSNGYKNARNKLERTNTLPASTSDLSLATFNGRPTFAFGDATMSLEQLQQQQQQAMGTFSSFAPPSSAPSGSGAPGLPSLGGQDVNLWSATALSGVPPLPSSTAATLAQSLPGVQAPLAAGSTSFAPSSTATAPQFPSSASFSPPPVPTWPPAPPTTMAMDTGFSPAPIDAALFGGASAADAGGWQSMLGGMPLASPTTDAQQQQQQQGFGAFGLDFNFGVPGAAGGTTTGDGMDLWGE